MARIFKVKDLEEKKRALAEECEVYRQTLRLEVHNLQMHAVWTKRRFTSITTSPLWTFIPPLLGSFLKRKRRSSKWRMISTALAVWQLYRKFKGFVGFLPRFRRKLSPEEERAPAVTI